MNIALIGNQNCGKTTLFNRLTGSRQKVGNFPGVTVDVASGPLRGKKGFTIVDLPGVYSLSPYSNEEKVTRDYLFKSRPDCVINILDATNLNRNLYLTMQVLETQTPTIVALNMMDDVKANGMVIDIEKLSEYLGVVVVPISAAKNQGIEELIEHCVKVCLAKEKNTFKDRCEGPIHTAIHSISHLVETNAAKSGLPAKFSAIRIIENDAEIIEELRLAPNQVEIINHFVEDLEKALGTDRESAVVDMRYGNIEVICADVIKKYGDNKSQRRTDKIDKILTHKVFALPIFIGIMGLIFYITFGIVGKYATDGMSILMDMAGEGLKSLLVSLQVSDWLVGLVVDGIFAGISSVLSFLPTIIVLFLLLSIVEDTGYMARVAFVMDKLLRKIGLSGRSIVPMLIGFGCSVPAYMSTRTISSERDRKLTLLMVPFMSCNAKVPVYAIITMTFFQKYQALVMLFMYVLGIVVGILYALILQKTKFKGSSAPFVMELPPYRLPSGKTVIMYMWDKAKGFIVKAFTVILIASVAVWFLTNVSFTFSMVEDTGDSILAMISKWISPIFAPLGFGDWRLTTSLIAGLSAKEAVVSTLAILFNVTQAELPAALGGLMSPLRALSFLIFVSLYMPCLAAFATLRKEVKSTGYAVLAMALQTFIAYIVALVIYTFGLLVTL